MLQDLETDSTAQVETTDYKEHRSDFYSDSSFYFCSVRFTRTVNHCFRFFNRT